MDLLPQPEAGGHGKGSHYNHLESTWIKGNSENFNLKGSIVQPPIDDAQAAMIERLNAIPMDKYAAYIHPVWSSHNAIIGRRGFGCMRDDGKAGEIVLRHWTSRFRNGWANNGVSGSAPDGAQAITA